MMTVVARTQKITRVGECDFTYKLVKSQNGKDVPYGYTR